MQVSNQEFLSAIFAEDTPFVHVTDFTYDPGAIPAGKAHLIAWKGDWFSRYQFSATPSNQYFTISIFAPDERGDARRRKALYLRTRVVVLDDVREKLSIDEAQKLPRPSWILETSAGSEQWGYILDVPCADRSRVENLLDGLVANGLAPEGRDPGMKGVTRYVRLPEGVNNKASKLVDGQPWQCRMLLWEPFNRVSLEQLAHPFSVNLDAARREARVDGAADVGDHPLLRVPDIIQIKEVRSDGRFDITCPWVDEHTGQDDSGSAVFTNADGTIGFKCHHGACQSRTGADLLRYIESEVPGFGGQFSEWKAQRSFAQFESNFYQPATVQSDATEGHGYPGLHGTGGQTPQTISFFRATEASAGPVQNPADDRPAVAGSDPLQQWLDALRRERHDSPEAKRIAAEFLRLIEDLPKIDQLSWHKQICDVMYWSKAEFKEIIKDLRAAWYQSSKGDINFFDDVVYIGEVNQFYDRKKRIFYTAEAYQNTYAHLDPDARKEALTGGRVMKVDRLDYAPKAPAVFEENGVCFANAWCATAEIHGTPGDASPWLSHWDKMGWGEYRDHMLKFMAHTLIYPERKINHMMTLGGLEGSGKDFLLYPFIRALGEHSITISGEELLEGFNDYLLNTKHVHVNETELGDRKEAKAVSAKLKPLAAAPPERLRVNQKGLKKIQVRNLLSLTMTTNSYLPVRLSGETRRIFAAWSDLNVRDRNGHMKQMWKDYWKAQWSWMQDEGGVDACIWYLRNCVDLTDFNPGEAPPVTEFLENIQEASKSPQQLTLEAFIAKRIGSFAADLVTVNEALATLKAGNLLSPDDMHCSVDYFNQTNIGLALQTVAGCIQRRCSLGDATKRVWIIRNEEQYQDLSGPELYRAHEHLRREVINSAKLRVV